MSLLAPPKKVARREPADHALGCSRGGWGAQLHVVNDGAGIPLAVKLSPGQAHESLYAESVLDSMRVCLPSGTVRQRAERMAGDKAYSQRRIRQWLRQRHIRAVIPERRDQQQRRRNVIERCIGWLKEARAVATCFEKLALHHLGGVKLPMIRRCL
ncbi:IS5 family transposase [Eleftheria terrae]|uniref:IS5 family transposase n=1 Tax=Eleftheria terrae TaxID=1597781 RepID=UPI00263B4528|nr:IS5 family transposase [Eleftheria terrae]WKB56198.1 IS5 family transposase [Eleftheria terrae]